MAYVPETPYPVPEGTPVPQTPRIFTAAFVVAIIAIALIVVFNPFSEEAREARKAQAAAKLAAEQARLLEEKRLAEYAALEKTVRPLHEEAKKKLMAFDAVANPLFQEVEHVAGRSLDRLTAKPPDVPKAIVDAFRFEESFRKPWNEILNAFIAAKDFRGLVALPDVAAKIEGRALTETDRKALDAFIAAAPSVHARIETQRENLGIVRRVLAQREINAMISNPSRSSP